MTALTGDRAACARVSSGAWPAAVAAAAGVAVIARLPQVFILPFWEDEVASARIIRQPTLAAVLHHVRLTESTPPLWYVLAWLVHRGGVPFRDERLLSVVFGGTLAACVVVLAGRVLPRAAALLAGVFVALGNEFVFHGHELRSYELVALLACLLGLCLVRELERPGPRRELALAGCVAAGGSTHYYFAFLVAPALAWLWLDAAARPVRARASVAICAGGAVACVWLPMMLRQYEQNRFWWIGPFDVRAVVAVPQRLFTTAGAGTAVGLAGSLLFFGVVVLGSGRLSRSPVGRLVIVLAFGPLLEAAAVWLAGSNTFDLRNLIVIGPSVAILAAAALAAAPAKPTAAIGLAATAALTAGVVLTGRGPAYDAIARALVRDGWSTAAPIAVYGDPTLYRAPLEWYLPHQPRLALARPRDAACGDVFLVRRSGLVVVLRPMRSARAFAQLRHTRLLAPPGHMPPCARRLEQPRTAVAAGTPGPGGRQPL